MRMMEAYPEYIFGASQAQLYQWTKENYPHLYEEIKGNCTKQMGSARCWLG